MSDRAGFPTGPIVDSEGNPNTVGRQFLLALYNRTGGAGGAATPDLAAETTARQAADTAEATARTAAVAAEATARATAITGLQGQISGLPDPYLVALLLR